MSQLLSIVGIVDVCESEVIALIMDHCKAKEDTLFSCDDGTPQDTFSGKKAHLPYPPHAIHWEEMAEELSRRLEKLIFSFHIHDRSLQMYSLYMEGTQVDGSNPEYCDDYITREERKAYRKSIEIICQSVLRLDPKDIEKHLVAQDQHKLRGPFHLMTSIEQERHSSDLAIVNGSLWIARSISPYSKLPTAGCESAP